MQLCINEVNLGAEYRINERFSVGINEAKPLNGSEL